MGKIYFILAIPLLSGCIYVQDRSMDLQIKEIGSILATDSDSDVIERLSCNSDTPILPTLNLSVNLDLYNRSYVWKGLSGEDKTLHIYRSMMDDDKIQKIEISMPHSIRINREIRGQKRSDKNQTSRQ